MALSSLWLRVNELLFPGLAFFLGDESEDSLALLFRFLLPSEEFFLDVPLVRASPGFDLLARFPRLESILLKYPTTRSRWVFAIDECFPLLKLRLRWVNLVYPININN